CSWCLTPKSRPPWCRPKHRRRPRPSPAYRNTRAEYANSFAEIFARAGTPQARPPPKHGAPRSARPMRAVHAQETRRGSVTSVLVPTKTSPALVVVLALLGFLLVTAAQSA